MRRWIVGITAVVVVVAAAALIAGGSLGPGAGSGSTSTPLPPVPPSDRVVAEARAVPATFATVSASVPGTITRVAVAEGDRVDAGTVLLELDDAAAMADAAAARAGLESATASADRATAAATQASAEVDRAAAAVRSAKAVRAQLPKGASRAQERQADAEVDAAEAGLASARAARDAADAAATAAMADVARAQAAVDAADVSLAQLGILAPIAGTVAEVVPSSGDVVTAGAPLVRLAGDGGWIFETTDLTQDEVAGISLDAAASVTLDGFPQTRIEGTVTRIGAYGEDRQGDVVFTVVIEPTSDVPPGVRWNMLASAEIATTP